MHRYARTLFFAVLASVPAACAGVGNAPPGTPAGAVSNTSTSMLRASRRVTAKLVIHIPRRKHHRGARFVSPSTQSIVISTQETAPVPGAAATSYANLVAGSPDCSGGGAPFTCTVTLPGLNVGATYSLTFVTYDATQTSASAPYNGKALSQNAVSKTIVAGADNTVGVTLDGIPASFAVVPAANTQPFGGSTASGLYFGYLNRQTWTILTLDIDDNFIVGPGAPQVTASIDVGATGGITVTPSVSNPNRITIGATSPGTGTLLLSAPVPGSNTPLSRGVGLTAGTLTTTIAGQIATQPTGGSANGTGTQAQFFRPIGLAYNASDGNVYIADNGNCTIRQLTPATFAVTTPAGTARTCAYQNGVGSAAFFNRPTAVAADSSGNLYVTDTNNFAIRMVAPGGGVSTLTGDNGSGTLDGGPGIAQFESAEALAYDPDDDDLYVVDSSACTVRRVTLTGTSPGTVSTIAGVADTCDGSGSDFNAPIGIAYAGNQTLYVTDSANCEIRRITNIDTALPQADTVASPFAGNSGACAYLNGVGAAAEFAAPGFLAYDPTHTVLYVLDDGTIRAVTVPGAAVTTIAGTPGSVIHSDGWQATFKLLDGLAYDPASAILYVSDRTDYVIEEVQL